jgi:hypothetical protein
MEHCGIFYELFRRGRWLPILSKTTMWEATYAGHAFVISSVPEDDLMTC